jgi:hypothetical protein
MFFGSLDHSKKKFKVVSKDNKIAEIFKMAARHESARTHQSILMQILDFGRTIKLKNIAKVTFFKTSKWRIDSRWPHRPLFYTSYSISVNSLPFLKSKIILNRL